MSKFDKVFKKNMTSKQIAFVFFSLCDIYKDDEKQMKALNKAFDKAYEKAQDRECNLFLKNISS